MTAQTKHSSVEFRPLRCRGPHDACNRLTDARTAPTFEPHNGIVACLKHSSRQDKSHAHKNLPRTKKWPHAVCRPFSDYKSMSPLTPFHCGACTTPLSNEKPWKATSREESKWRRTQNETSHGTQFLAAMHAGVTYQDLMPHNGYDPFFLHRLQNETCNH